MFIQFFSSHFSEGIFCFLCPNSSACRYVFPKTKTDKRKGEIKTKTAKEKKKKEKYVHNIQRVMIK